MPAQHGGVEAELAPQGGEASGRPLPPGPLQAPGKAEAGALWAWPAVVTQLEQHLHSHPALGPTWLQGSQLTAPGKATASLVPLLLRVLSGEWGWW